MQVKIYFLFCNFGIIRQTRKAVQYFRGDCFAHIVQCHTDLPFHARRHFGTRSPGKGRLQRSPCLIDYQYLELLYELCRKTNLLYMIRCSRVSSIHCMRFRDYHIDFVFHLQIVTVFGVKSYFVNLIFFQN